MTDDPRQDLEREAREAQRFAGFLSQPSDLSSCQHERSCAAFRINEITGYFDSVPCDCGAISRWGDLAAKRIRANEAEIASLRAKLAAVPVEEIRECAKECRNTWPEEGIADDARAIDRWLATVTK